MKISANLGFLWTELTLPEAIAAAKAAGFDAVECHWPYDVPTGDVTAALNTSSLKMLGLNTRRGDTTRGENGLAALPGRDADARAAIDEAIAYATAIGAQKVHVMPGFSAGPTAHKTFVENLAYAADKAAPHNITILLEPLNRYDAPGYFLSRTEQAAAIIADVATPNVKLMFDCYHVQLMEGDLTNRLLALMPLIGHIQFASVPSRGAPDGGEVNYTHIFKVIAAEGYTDPIGAEYKPAGNTEPTLGWLQAAQAI
ncbi:MAG: TIM barrel protein [Pseudomonadota bacterium]